MLKQKRRNKEGLSLIELLVALIVFFIIVLGAISFLGWTLQRTAQADNRLEASLAMERCLAIQFEQLSKTPDIFNYVPAGDEGLVFKDMADIVAGAPTFPNPEAFPEVRVTPDSQALSVEIALSVHPNDMTPADPELFLLTVAAGVNSANTQRTEGSLVVRRP